MVDFKREITISTDISQLVNSSILPWIWAWDLLRIIRLVTLRADTNHSSIWWWMAIFLNKLADAVRWRRLCRDVDIFVCSDQEINVLMTEEKEKNH